LTTLENEHLEVTLRENSNPDILKRNNVVYEFGSSWSYH